MVMSTVASQQGEKKFFPMFCNLLWGKERSELCRQRYLNLDLSCHVINRRKFETGFPYSISDSKRETKQQISTTFGLVLFHHSFNGI